MRIFITLILLSIHIISHAQRASYPIKTNNINSEEKHKLCDEYLEVATSLYKKRNYHDALTNYINAEKLIDGEKDLYLKTFIIHGMALTHFQLNNYDESEKLLLENFNYFNNVIEKGDGDVGHQLGFLNTLSRLTYLYILKKDINKAIEYNDLDFRKTENFKDDLNYFYALKNKGIIQYKQKKYKQSINTLIKAIPNIENNDDYYWVMVCYFYIARNYKQLGDVKNAIDNYEKVNDYFNKTNIIDDIVRKNFTELIHLYEKNSNTEKQLEKVNSLLKFDSINYATNNEISNKYYKEYAYNDLIKSQKDLQTKLSNQNSRVSFIFIIIFIAFISSCYVGYKWYLNRVKQIKIQFNSVIDEHLSKINRLNKEKSALESIQESVSSEENQVVSSVDANVKQEILNRLCLLEKEYFFIDPSTSLVSLASKLETNTKYLSNIINEEKGENFKKYINDLRIDYIINLLIEDRSYHKYSIEGLADLCGFKSRQKFSDHFLEYTKIRPSVFLKNIEDFDREQFVKSEI